MSVTERDPGMTGAERTEAEPDRPRPAAVLRPREVPLGGPRAMTVRRTLPQRERSLVGPWCFVDHYGPDDTSGGPGMRVPGHPHTGLQTVTWLFAGEIEHRDTVGTRRVVRPGELNLMTAGSGVAHSEFQVAGGTLLHGAQLWLALPAAALDAERRFEHFVPEPFAHDGAVVAVFLGEWLCRSATPRTWTRVLGAEVRIPARTLWRAPVDPRDEVGALVDTGHVRIGGHDASPADFVVLADGTDELVVETGDEDVRLLVLAGEPLGEPIVMWWNFIGRDHDDIVRAREDWMHQVALGAGADGRFGPHPDAWSGVLPAPELPTVRLRPRA